LSDKQRGFAMNEREREREEEKFVIYVTGKTDENEL